MRSPFDLFYNRALATSPEWDNLIDLGIQWHDESYSEQMSRVSLKLITERLRDLEICGYESVLDLGCGYGQWTKVLSVLNDRAYGVDINVGRIEIAKTLFPESKMSSELHFGVAQATSTPFPDAFFDVVFCYGVFMFLDPDDALKEIHRILRPGGRIYISTNSDGWWLSIFLKSVFTSKSLRNASFRALSRRKKSLPTSFTVKSLANELTNHQFSIIGIGPEGSINAANPITSFYRKKFLGLLVTIEVLACKEV